MGKRRERPVPGGRGLAHLPWFLRAPRAAGLWALGILIPIATLAGFIASYRGLFDWAVHHGWPLYLAPLFPLLIDLLIISGEVVLFVAAIDGDTSRWVRGWAWAMTVSFTGLSVAGNVSHAATADIPTRVGWALPPVVLALALGFGLGILKRQAAKYRPVSKPVSASPAAEYTQRRIMAEVGVGQDKARAVQRLLRHAAASGLSPTGDRDVAPSVPVTLNGDRP